METFINASIGLIAFIGVIAFITVPLLLVVIYKNRKDGVKLYKTYNFCMLSNFILLVVLVH